MQRMLSLFRSCIDDYQMISENDRIAVGVSGGKDSVTLLVLLAELRKFYPKPFSIEAFTVDMGLSGMGKAITEAGIHKIALGHHKDDAVETFLMSLIYEGRISCFEPVTYLDRTEVTQIRPMLYIPEKTISHFAEKEKLPVIFNTCPADKHTKREDTKELISDMIEKYPGFKEKIFGAIQRYPLHNWEVKKEKRR